MRWLMASTLVLMLDFWATVSAIFILLDRLASIHWLASSTAIITARVVLGFFLTKSAEVPSTFSGWSFQMSWVVLAVTPMPSMMARWFQGSPTQNPSMLPTRMLATIWGGGTVISLAPDSGWMPVGEVPAKVYSRLLAAMNLARGGPSTAPLSASALDSVIAWPLLFRLISTAMSFLGPAVPMCTPYTRPYSTWAKSSSPFTSLSRTPAHDASLVGMIVTPYFLSKPSTEAITTLAQSVSGMKPILTSFFSGASEPWACTRARSAGLTPTAPTVAACSTVRRLRLVFNRSVMGGFRGALENKKGVLPWPGRTRKRARRGTPLSMAKPVGGRCVNAGPPLGQCCQWWDRLWSCQG